MMFQEILIQVLDEDFIKQEKIEIKVFTYQELPQINSKTQDLIAYYLIVQIKVK